jgi:hypothetical protein
MKAGKERILAAQEAQIITSVIYVLANVNDTGLEAMARKGTK